MNRLRGTLLFGLLSLCMGAISGAAVWAVLRVMNLGIRLFWETLPERLGAGNSLWYLMAICLSGGLLIGLWQRREGLLPDELTQVIGRIRETGGYPYDRLHVIAVSALLPLIFGGALGPEAGLSGLIAGLCCWVGDRLKYGGDRLHALTEVGLAATLSAVFGAPLFGIADRLEPEDRREGYRKRLLGKKGRVFLYCMGVAGAMLAMYGLGKLFGTSGGLPRFSRSHGTGIDQWKWVLPLILLGVITALAYLILNTLTARLGDALKPYRVVSCLAAGAALAVVGYLLPESMFSGEHQLGVLIEEWQQWPVWLLAATALGKLLLVNLCVNLGWRGGSIFPMIFSGAALGYAFAAITGMDGAFAVAVLTSAFCAYVMRKPAAVAAVLLLCFPLTYLLPILAAAIVSARIPVPKALRRGEERAEP